MKSETEVKEKLAYYRGYAEGLRKSGGHIPKSEETEATRVWVWIDALVWVLGEERTNE